MATIMKDGREYLSSKSTAFVLVDSNSESDENDLVIDEDAAENVIDLTMNRRPNTTLVSKSINNHVVHKIPFNLPVESEEKYFCHVCKESFPSNLSLIRHVKMKHGPNTSHEKEEVAGVVQKPIQRTSFCRGMQNSTSMANLVRESVIIDLTKEPKKKSNKKYQVSEKIHAAKSTINKIKHAANPVLSPCLNNGQSASVKSVNKTASSNKNLIDFKVLHEELQHGDSYICDICDEKFRYHVALLCHQDSEHSATVTKTPTSDAFNHNSSKTTKKKKTTATTTTTKAVRKNSTAKCNKKSEAEVVDIEPNLELEESIIDTDPTKKDTVNVELKAKGQNSDDLYVIKRDHYGNIVSRTCRRCAKVLRNNNSRHLKDCHREPKYKCPCCNQTFIWELKYRKHMSVRHNIINFIVCPKCTLSYTSFDVHNCPPDADKNTNNVIEGENSSCR